MPMQRQSGNVAGDTVALAQSSGARQKSAIAAKHSESPKRKKSLASKSHSKGESNHSSSNSYDSDSSDDSSSSNSSNSRKSNNAATQFSVTSLISKEPLVSASVNKASRKSFLKSAVLESDSVGLRMKIAAIPRAESVAGNRDPKSEHIVNNRIKKLKKTIHHLSSSDSSSSSDTSGSEDNDDGSSSDENDKKTVPKKAATIHKRSINNMSSSSSDDSDSSSSTSSDDHTKKKETQIPQNPPQLQKRSATQEKRLSGPISVLSSLKKLQTPRPSYSSETLGADCASSSDLDLPALVNAAIERVDRFSDNESTRDCPTQYTSSLLREFNLKTQKLGTTSSAQSTQKLAASLKSDPVTVEIVPTVKKIVPKVEIKTETTALSKVAVVPPTQPVEVKRKRGRPKKIQPVQNVLPVVSSASPDSGIISTPQSPVQPLLTTKSTNKSVENAKESDKAKKVTKKKPVKPIPKEPAVKKTSNLHRLSMTSLEKTMYANERVLYPPRRNKRSVANAKSLTKSVSDLSQQRDETLDPAWRKIDVNKKFSRPSLSGYKSDGGKGTVCSKVLAAQSGYLSDYGHVSHRRMSGYKSDYSFKSRRSGYKSDFSTKSTAKSCGYRSDCSFKHRRKIRRKKRSKFASTAKSPINDLDILQLAGLSLGQSSEESSLDSSIPANKTENALGSAVKEISFNLLGKVKQPQAIKGRSFSSLNNGISNSRSDTNTPKQDASDDNNSNTKTDVNTELQNRRFLSIADTLNDQVKPMSIRRRRTSVVSHCSSRSGCSRHHFRRKRRKRLRSFRSDAMTSATISKMNIQVELLAASFSTLCKIATEKVIKPSHPSTSDKTVTRRVTKKRKGSENVDSPSTGGQITKRRHKKTVQAESQDEHKLPLKKRHYLLAPGEKSDGKQPAEIPAVENKKEIKNVELTEAQMKNVTVSISTKSVTLPKNIANVTTTKSSVTKAAVTPKKRHLLESPHSQTLENDVTSAPSKSGSETLPMPASFSSRVASVDHKKEAVAANSAEPKATSHPAKRNDVLTRKKNRLEVLVSKIQTSTPEPTANIGESSPQEQTNKVPAKSQAIVDISSKTSKAQTARPTVIQTSSSIPPPGIFEPTEDLELQIPMTAISIVTKTEIDSPKLFTDLLSKQDGDDMRPESNVIETLLTKTGGHAILKRKRKRRAINRTGFPTVKRKKKKITSPSHVMSPVPVDNKNNIVALVDEKKEDAVVDCKSETDDLICDRVPQEGEPTDTYIERHSRPRLSVVSLEKLQGKNSTPEREEATAKLRGKRQRDTSQEEAAFAKGAPDKKLKQKLESMDPKPRDKSSDSEPLINLVRIKAAAARVGSKISKATVPENPPIEDNNNQSGDLLTRKCKSIFRNNNVRGSMRRVIDTDELKENKDQKSGMESKVERVQKEKNEVGLQVEKDKNDSKVDKSLSETSSQPLKSEVSKQHGKLNKKLKEENKKSIKIKEIPPKASKSLLKDGKVSELKSADGKKDPTPNSKESSRENTKDDGRKRSLESKSKSHIKNGKIIEKIDKRFKDSKIVKDSKADKNNADNDRKRSKGKGSRHSITDESDKSIKKGSDNSTDKGTKPRKVETTKTKKESNVTSSRNKTDVEETQKTSSDLKKSTQKAAENEEQLQDESTPLLEIILPDHSLKDAEEDDPLPREETLQDDGADSDNSKAEKKLPNGKNSSKLKKKYLAAGLFSTYFKEDKPSKVLGTEKHLKPYNPLDFPNGLLPALPYCDRFFRQTIIDFLLPNDIWSAHENSKLIGKNAVPSWNYKKVRVNVYNDIRSSPSMDHQPCSCKPDNGCGDDCLNRLVYTECTPETCPCKERCQNQKIQRHDVCPGVERFMTENKGWGVRTNLEIKKGTYILEYVGEVVTEKEFKDRMASLYTRDTHHYCLHLDGGLVIDGHRMGSDGRFVNHSCLPNCEMQKWSVNGLFRMALFAQRDIPPGEELTYDYNFSLFNPSEGQPCRCDTPHCRGVIGGKSQRVKPIESNKVDENTCPRSGRTRKRQARKNQQLSQSKDSSSVLSFQVPTAKEKNIIRLNNCFLLRNLEKIRRLKSGIVSLATAALAPMSLAAQIAALRGSRNIRTRGVTMATNDPATEKIVRIAGFLREICQDLNSEKDDKNQSVISRLNLPSKKKLPLYYERIPTPIEMSVIEANVEKGYYGSVMQFDQDILRMFGNAIKFFGTSSEEGVAVETLQKRYLEKKKSVVESLKQIVGDTENLDQFIPAYPLQLFQPIDPTEDIIRCICGLYKDEGLMIQCAKCMVWQHTECTKADTSVDSYLCEKCDKDRVVDYEIPLDEFTDEGYRYYLSLMRDNLQIRQGDTVYVLRDIPIDETEQLKLGVKKHTYKTIGHIDYSECDIFRVERLWKDNDGARFIFGHHYLRPHETFHEPTRRFYSNEVVRVPYYEVVPIELIMGRCWVLDVKTFCKGRPADSAEPHVYICELRVDKAARLFTKSKSSHPVCTKSYAFHKFEHQLKIVRNYAPHDVAVAHKVRRRKGEENVQQEKPSRKLQAAIIQLLPPPQKTIQERRSRLEGVLSKLMNKLKSTMENSPPVDLSYLVTGRGARRRVNATSVPQ